ncbi:MAG: hypothetical protein N2327_06580 [Caldimicrobium sp.]|nr:hypothetical protein [Caldimicrobium sp.]MCX7874078.1 hypothetical protein [Caldimicrobium sp.]MDW8094366.1 hypothetical protein [Caldimicrobium sp.]
MIIIKQATKYSQMDGRLVCKHGRTGQIYHLKIAGYKIINDLLAG